MSDFVHLHTHSHYSLLNALPKIPDLVTAAQGDGMDALALTDNGNLYGTISFYKTCKKAGIKPIIGVDCYVAARTRRDKEPGIDNRRSRLVLLAKNKTGYQNLLQLVTRSHLEGFYYKPRVDHELIETYAGGLVAIIPSFSGETSMMLKGNDHNKALETLEWYQSVFGPENTYLELTHHPEIEGHDELSKKIVALSLSGGVPLVASHDVYYLKPEDRLARETLLKIQTGSDFGERGGLDGSEEDFSFISQETAKKYFADLPDALANTKRIAGQCTLDLSLGAWVFPKFSIPSGTTCDGQLRRITLLGLAERGLADRPDVRERIDYELSVIADKGYAPYFLVVADLIRFAHENNILTTTRGSAAGSMVSYATKITNVDPIEYGLPFERFLNPHRPSAPDIDMDFADNRRDEVIRYAREKYGEDRVAQIGTFGTMMARAAVRDIARALGHPYNVGDRIARLIPFGSQGFPMTIERAMEMIDELRDLYKKDRDAKEIIDLAKKIEGGARHMGVHAAGVVIAPSPLVEYVPLQEDPKGGKIVTQYDMHAVEDAGLLKLDFLGITNLSILADSVERVKKLRDIDIDIENIPLDDTKTFEMLARGDTEGLFQLNGSGMTRFLKELEPTTIHDINAMVALYRPGPMLNIPEYIARKKGERQITYYHPKMRSFLLKSYGILVYQDDLLFTAMEIAGYNWKSVDAFRKAVGKKIPEEMAKQHTIFVEGCKKNSGMSEKEAEGLWRLFEPFQGYGFNKAHAASYGKVAYQTAYMKANFPVEYMAAVLTAEAGDVDKVAVSIGECKRLGIDVLPPSANDSLGDFTVVKTGGEILPKIRFGLHSIKNFGAGVADTIIMERKRGGRYGSLADFLERIHDKNLNKKSLEALVKCGALDEFSERQTMLANLDHLLAYHKETAAAPSGQDSLFGGTAKTAASQATLLPWKAGSASAEEKLRWEKELLGLYISGHPLDKYKDKLARAEKSIVLLTKELRPGMQAILPGLIEDVRIIMTKNGEQMAFIRLADLSGSIEVVAFPRTYKTYRDLLAPETCVMVKGRLSDRNGETSLVAEAVKAL